ncbi:MAG: hypothetical protein IIA61_08235 [Candidatus Marinimicrobia bacterium]|nr:hypothetical protein [Candidatus Neomarinimicrobiota bacterium]
MLNKLIWDFKRGKIFYRIADVVSSQKLGEYYFVFDEERVRAGKDQALISSYDENGIPLNKTYIDVSKEKLVYFPITIGQMGLAVYQTYLKTQDQRDLDMFLKFAEWFLQNGMDDDKLGVRWLTDVPLPAYRNLGPWQSAFAQSRAISILLRAYQATEKQEYAKVAEKALVSFQYSVSEGGVVSYTEWGPFYEEYTASVPVLVLNGHIFSLFGLLDFHRVFPEQKTAKTLFEVGVETVLNCLPSFDLGYWSRYNYCQADFYPTIDPATLGYQRLHILLLKVMNKIRTSEILVKYINRWENQVHPLNYMKSSWHKYLALKSLNRI